MSEVALIDARDEAELGGKAVQLGAALRAGLPVPSGVALSATLIEAFVAGDRDAAATVAAAFARVGSPAAARSSAVGEDSATASFAGQHLTCLGVTTDAAALDAVTQIAKSAHADAAFAYRRRLGIAGVPRIGVVLQRLITPECAGVLFTRCPTTGRDERVIEISWGLGEAVVAGLVTPDRLRLDRQGRCIEMTIGHKDVEILARFGGGTEEVAVSAERARRPCLDEVRIAAIHRLAARCEDAFGPGPHDIELAFANDELWLLQRRAVTRQSQTQTQSVPK